MSEVDDERDDQRATCLVLRFTVCPRANPIRCAQCTIAEQARMAALLAHPYWRRRVDRIRR